MGIEPTAQAWEAWVLPLYDARRSPILIRFHIVGNFSSAALGPPTDLHPRTWQPSSRRNRHRDPIAIAMSTTASRLARGLDLHHQILAANVGLQVNRCGPPHFMRENCLDAAQVRSMAQVHFQLE